MRRNASTYLMYFTFNTLFCDDFHGKRVRCRCICLFSNATSFFLSLAGGRKKGSIFTQNGSWCDSLSQHSWPSIYKLLPNDRHISFLLRHVEYCKTWNLANKYNIIQHPQMLHEKFDHFPFIFATRCNRVVKGEQHVAPINVAICCIEMLQSFGRGFKK